MSLTWQVLEDNGGGLYLAVFDEFDACIYYASGCEHNPESLREDIAALRRGDDPRDGWEQQEGDPAERYAQLTSYEFGWSVVADETGLYPHRMGASAKAVFAHIPGGASQYRTTYTRGEQRHAAYHLPMDRVRNLLGGRDHDGSWDDDDFLTFCLERNGAEEWVEWGDGDAHRDDGGWWLVGPPVTSGVES